METDHGQSWNHVDDKSTVYLQSQCCACNCHLSEWEAPGARNQGDKVSRIRGRRPHVKPDTVDIRSTPIPLFPFGKFSSVDGTLPIICSGRGIVRLKRLRTSEKVRDRVGNNIHVKLSKKQGSLCSSLFGKFRSRFSRIKMTRFFCHCVLVILLTSCAGIYINNSANTHTKETSVIYKQPPYQPEESIPIIRDIPFRSISLENFKMHLKTTRNPYDLLRIFFEDSNLSDFTIENVMKMKSKRVYSSKSRRNFADYEYDEFEEGSFNTETLNLALKHINEIQTNPDAQCRDPRPEVVSVVGTGSTLRYYVPECTVIHRCRNTSGCCGPNMVCAPKMLQIVEKPFMVLEINKDGVRPEKNKQFLVYETFVNHTECECRQLEGHPACDKKCPRQFTMSRPHSHCECTCLPDNNNCLDIYKGRIPLDEKSLECIKSGDCLEPQCHTGKFNVRNGFCTTVHPHDEYKKAFRNRGRR
ncbi:hypothetical protein CHS0354_041927 [Potamilus streckersoni]|uniref:Platelet-derived growth factor (PDGF) family profile domain-containing protein n=1 Tax=Potamilus streckersoni TaxID=2493646 RepID=A0AAE0ST94_9BIVA|nr:hypothetical protein CHS0354_041927 [Potamilus streckersoni]